MDAGDGRNQALFNYILTLQSADFEKEEARDCLRMINKYVLKEPLAEDELDVIMRDEAFSNRAIENFTDEDVTVDQGETKKSVVVTDNITVVNTMEKLYMTVYVA